MQRKLTNRTIKKLSKSKIGIIILVICIGYYTYQSQQPIEKNERITVTLDSVVDGDTAWFIINGKKTKTRFLYIDTPESTAIIEPYGKQATDFVDKTLSNASKIEIETNSDGNQYDKYDRMLVWVFVDNQLLQAMIAKEGYVEKYYDYGYHYAYKQEIIEANQYAKTNKLGIYQ